MSASAAALALTTAVASVPALASEVTGKLLLATYRPEAKEPAPGAFQWEIENGVKEVTPDRVDAKLAGDVHHPIERLERLVGDGRVDAHAKRRVPSAGGRLQPPQPGGRALERALHAAGAIVQLTGPVDRDADVAQEAGGSGK